MKEMHELRDALVTELTKVSQRGVTSANLEMIDKLTHSIKSIDTILAMGGDYSGTYEGDNYGYSRNMSYGRGYGNSYGRDDGYSYARRRDSMGRYSRDDETIQTLRDMMQSTNDTKLKNALRKAIDSVEM